MTNAHLTGADGRRYVRRQIRKALRNGDLAPGQRLVEQDLVREHGVTRNAVREALVDLSAEGIVELVPQRGARVRVVSTEDAIQITECRQALECLCARKAAQLASDEQLRQLQVLRDRMVEAVDAGAFDTYSSLNQEMHALMIEASGQKVAQRLLDQLNNQMIRHQFRLSLRPGRPAQSLAQHAAIVDALVARDPDAAQAAIIRHLASVIDQLRATDDLG